MLDHRNALESWLARAKSRHCCQSAQAPSHKVAPVTTVPPWRCKYGRIPSNHTPRPAKSEAVKVITPLIANDQAQRQPPESDGGAQGRAPNLPRLANGKRGGCSLQRSG